jgi:hypothetical protein
MSLFSCTVINLQLKHSKIYKTIWIRVVTHRISRSLMYMSSRARNDAALGNSEVLSADTVGARFDRPRNVLTERCLTGTNASKSYWWDYWLINYTEKGPKHTCLSLGTHYIGLAYPHIKVQVIIQFNSIQFVYYSDMPTRLQCTIYINLFQCGPALWAYKSL